MYRNRESGAVLGSDRFIPKKASGDAGFRRVRHGEKLRGGLPLSSLTKQPGEQDSGAGIRPRDMPGLAIRGIADLNLVQKRGHFMQGFWIRADFCRFKRFGQVCEGLETTK